ncbi:hypothetical protein [Streptococcus pantholopis]|uniref:DUF1433 domain-containing protein n=1 Tax=Streptococcus pantholopis TaxID=1811193 RepID=A0A172Q9Q0_9STRE|nr:hypothetical protein [Streptococcus pantholopis]AND80147.1 hypothetical protein A0O21_09110 [Streptococcus pantholopis]
MKNKKKYLLLLGIIVCIGGIIGGYRMLTKETLTKRQQDNVVKRLAKDYYIQSIEFTQFGKDQMTGAYLLNIKINNNDKLETTIPFNDLERLNNSSDSIGLNPIDDFEKIQREHPLEEIDISSIKITYLEE